MIQHKLIGGTKTNKKSVHKDKNIIIHISGPQGAGKTTTGKKLAFVFKDRITVKDLDELYDDYIKENNRRSDSGSYVEISNKSYENYINTFIEDHKNKPLVFVGLDENACLGPSVETTNSYIKATYKYYIDISTTDNLRQWFYRQAEKLNDRKDFYFDQWLRNRSQMQEKLLRYVNLEEKEQMKKECDKLYKERGYIFMEPNEIYDECEQILEQATGFDVP